MTWNGPIWIPHETAGAFRLARIAFMILQENNGVSSAENLARDVVDRIYATAPLESRNAVFKGVLEITTIEERSSATRRKSDIVRHIQFGSVEPIPLAWLSLSFCKCRKKHQELQVRASCLRDS
jgi:hypothetical protein